MLAGPGAPELPPLPPVAGKLFVSGEVGGSVSRPEGHIGLTLSDGRVGAVRLGHATLQVYINHERTASFVGEANPVASASAGAGHVRFAGTVPLPDAPSQAISVDWSVQDGGMQLLTALAPQIAEWQHGKGTDVAEYAFPPRHRLHTFQQHPSFLESVNFHAR